MLPLGCEACHGSGWLAFTRTISGRRYPWAAACHCARGQMLSQSRPGSKDIGTPIVVVQADRELYVAAMREARGFNDSTANCSQSTGTLG